MISKYIYSIAIVLILIGSCKKSTENVFTSSSYPLAVGDWWQYQLTSIGYATDTFMLSVISVSSLGPYTQYNCNFIGNGATTPAGYFLQSDTDMYFVNSTPYADFSAFPNFQLKFPVKAGQYWPGAFPGDSTLVEAVVGSEGYYGHTYSPCYLTNESYNLPHNFKVQSMTLTPKVGLVHQSITFNSDTAGVQIQQSISLLNYHVE
jgi:hypothetical protein